MGGDASQTQCILSVKRHDMPENASLLPTLSLRTPVSNLWCECFIKAKFRSTDVPGKKQKMTQQGPWP